jgi:hypothetical protein
MHFDTFPIVEPVALQAWSIGRSSITIIKSLRDFKIPLSIVFPFLKSVKVCFYKYNSGAGKSYGDDFELKESR